MYTPNGNSLTLIKRYVIILQKQLQKHEILEQTLIKRHKDDAKSLKLQLAEINILTRYEDQLFNHMFSG